MSVLVILASCTPDTSHTAFRCDEHHACPPDQACAEGRCRRGAPTGDGIVCDTGLVCAQNQQCCVTLFSTPRCIAAGDECGGAAAFCDGREDCQPGDHCCDDSAVSCGADCESPVCREDADCPTTVPNCCDRDGPRWGHCSVFAC